MGTNIDREAFDEVDDARFQERLEQCLSTLGELLERPGFGVGPVTLGAELELFLVDGAARPLQHNQAVRAAAADARVNLELDRFNLELNATPTLLAGQPFTALGEELRLLLGRVAEAARAHGGRPVLVGILPTLRRADRGARVISDLPRYRALNSRLRGLRHDPFHLRIAGADPLELASDDVALEGAATSFQVHLRVDPDAFARSYNAAQAATAPVLAVAGNSPTLLGHRLWEETRIPLCKQSIDDRDGRGLRRGLARVAFGAGWLRGGPLGLFAEGVRLHQPLLPGRPARPGSRAHMAAWPRRPTVHAPRRRACARAAARRLGRAGPRGRGGSGGRPPARGDRGQGCDRADRRGVAVQDTGHAGATARPRACAGGDAGALPGVRCHRPAGPHLAHRGAAERSKGAIAPEPRMDPPRRGPAARSPLQRTDTGGGAADVRRGAAALQARWVGRRSRAARVGIAPRRPRRGTSTAPWRTR